MVPSATGREFEAPLASHSLSIRGVLLLPVDGGDGRSVPCVALHALTWLSSSFIESLQRETSNEKLPLRETGSFDSAYDRRSTRRSGQSA